jgi:hypothetical protein
MNTLKLGTITEEAAACRKRWKGYDTGTFAAHVHHDVPFEILTQSAGKRIAFILSEKPEDERALRLRCFAPVDMSRFPMTQQTRAAWEEIAAAWLKASAESKQIAAAWRAAEAERLKADAACKKLRTESRDSTAEWEEAVAAYLNADAVCEQVADTLRKARAEWMKVVPALEEICAAIPHAKLCPLGSDCPWDGKTIFRIGRKEK